jgi:C-terminal processing protease CtpA/Prc
MLQSPLRRGDVIVSVDGESPEDIAQQLLPYTRGSNLRAARWMLGRYLLRGEQPNADLLIQRGGQHFQLSVARIPGDSLDRSLLRAPAYGEESFSIMDNGFGFIDMASLSATGAEEVRETFAGLPGIIIDMRNPPSAGIFDEIAEFLVPEPTAFCVVSRSDTNNPGTFFMAESIFAGGGGTESFQGPVALLVDEGSMSSSEFHVMAWRMAPNCMVFGNVTNGADGNVNQFSLPGGIRTAFTGLGIYNPDGSETQRVGIQPNLVVLPTVAGMQSGSDEVLEAAVAWLESL